MATNNDQNNNKTTRTEQQFNLVFVFKQHLDLLYLQLNHFRAAMKNVDKFKRGVKGVLESEDNKNNPNNNINTTLISEFTKFDRNYRYWRKRLCKLDRKLLDVDLYDKLHELYESLIVDDEQQPKYRVPNFLDSKDTEQNEDNLVIDISDCVDEEVFISEDDIEVQLDTTEMEMKFLPTSINNNLVESPNYNYHPSHSRINSVKRHKVLPIVDNQVTKDNARNGSVISYVGKELFEDDDIEVQLDTPLENFQTETSLKFSTIISQNKLLSGLLANPVNKSHSKGIVDNPVEDIVKSPIVEEIFISEDDIEVQLDTFDMETSNLIKNGLHFTGSKMDGSNIVQSIIAIVDNPVKTYTPVKSPVDKEITKEKELTLSNSNSNETNSTSTQISISSSGLNGNNNNITRRRGKKSRKLKKTKNDTKVDSKPPETIHDRPYKCDRCDSSFKERKYLRTHQKVHEGIRFTCAFSECTTVIYSSRNSVLKHLKEFHALEKKLGSENWNGLYYKVSKDNSPNVQTRLMTCQIGGCQYRTMKMKRMKLHKAAIHKIDESDVRPFKCDQCEWSFKMKPQLAAHQSCVHDGIQFDCTFKGCKATYTNRYKLFRHYRRYHNEAPVLRCKWKGCHYSTHHNGSLKKHWKTHLISSGKLEAAGEEKR